MQRSRHLQWRGPDAPGRQATRRATSQAGRRRDLLVQTKLSPPVGSRGLIERSRLLDRIDATTDPPHLVCVSAAAGYGKSTLLSQWRDKLDDAGVATGWVTLDGGDNDPVRLLSYLLAAFGNAPGKTGRVAGRLEFGLPSVVRPLLVSLVQDLEQLDGRFVLFLDDFHLITDPATQELLDWLILHSPPSVGFVIAGRTRPPLSLSRLKVEGRLFEIGMPDLNFQLEETHRLLNELDGLELGRSETQALLNRTEGWAAGLKLVSLALRDAADRKRFIAEFSGSDRAITDYLGEVVLSRLEPDFRSFVLQTALLDRLCAGLCRAVSGREDSQHLLEQIEAENLFLLPLDRDRVWYRYHHLFADFLRARVTAECPELGPRTYRTASQWFARQHHDSEAVRYALLAEDFEAASDLIERCWEDLVEHRGEHGTLLRWVEALPADSLDARPQLRMAHAWSLTFTRRYAEAQSELGKLEAHYDGGADEDVASGMEMIRCVLHALTDHSESCRRASEEWLERWPEAPWFNTGTVASALAYACTVQNEFDRARRALAQARVAFRNCDAHYGMAWDYAIEGMILLQQGRLKDAIRVYRRGLATAAGSLGVESYAASMLSVLLAEALYEEDSLEEARSNLDAGFIWVNDHGAVETAFAGYATKAKLLYARGQREAMEETLLDGQRLGQRLGLPRLVCALEAERVRLTLRSGEVDQARKLAAEGGFIKGGDSLPSGESFDTARHIMQPIRAQLWIATGESERAISALGELIWMMRKRGRMREVIALLVARAAAYHGAGNRSAALRSLDDAVRLAAPEGFARVFLDEGPAVADLLEEMARSRPAIYGGEEAQVQEFLGNLTATADLEPGGRERAEDGNGAGRPSEPLTRSEGEILRLLCTGLTNRELAKTLFVSETTVKWHLRNLYTKLGVRNRTSAVACARRLSLV